MKRQKTSVPTAATSASLPVGQCPHSIAVRLTAAGFERVLIGQATVERDDELGSVLRVTFSSARDETLLIADDSWQGKTESGAPFGCDLYLSLN
jgi:hypothetical protein